MADAIVGSVAVEVVPSTRTWNAKIRSQLLPQADKLGTDIGDRIGRNAQEKIRERLAKLPDAKIGVNTKQADAELAKFRKNASKDATVAIKVNSRGLAGYKTQLAAATRDRTQKINVKADTSQLDKVLQKFSKLSLGGGAAKGIGIAALVPALGGLSTAVPVLGGLTAGLTTAGIGAGAFAAVAVPSFKQVQTAAQGLKKAQDQLNAARASGTSPTVVRAQLAYDKAQKNAAAAAGGSAKQQIAANDALRLAKLRLDQAEKNSPENKALQEQKKILDGLTPAQKTAVKQYQNFTDALDDFQKKVQPDVYPVIGGAFKLIGDQLPRVVPLVKGAAGAFHDLETDAGKALNSPFWKNFDDFVTKRGPESIQAYGKIAGNVVTGIFGTVQGFDPQIQTTQRGLLNLSRDFAHFGENAAAGKSKAFNDFTTFAHDTAPQVKKDLGDIGKLAGNTVVGLAPSVGPSLKLIDDVVKGVSPLIAPLEQKLPGIIGNIDKMVQKVSPLAQKLSGPFSEGVATTIDDVAGAIGDIAGWLDKIPEPVLKNIGQDIGVLVAAATISKLTGLSKLPGILKGIYNAFPKKGTKDPLDGMGGKFDDLGKKAGGAAGGLDQFSGAKNREKSALGGNDDLLDANATAMKKFGDEAETAGKKLGKLPGLAKGFFGLSAAAAIPAFNILANDNTSLGVQSAKKNLDTVKNKTVQINAEDLLQPQVRQANKLIDGVHGKTVDLNASNKTAAAVHSANSTVAGFHGKNVNLTASGLTGIRNTYQQAQGTVDQFHGKTANLTASGLTGIRNTYSQAQGIVNQFHGKSVNLTANGSGIRTAVSNAQSLINSLHGKNVTNTVTTNYVEHHSGGGKSSSSSKGLFGKGSDLTQGKKQDVFKLPLPLLDRVPAYARDFQLVGATGGKTATGKLRGPGTPTSDSIPAMLSTDEWVVKASRARQLGDSFMNWVNYGSGVNPPGFLRLYRDGGKVQHLASGGPAQLETESQYKRGLSGTGVKHTAAEWAQIEAAKGPQYVYQTTAATRAAAAKQRSTLQAAGEKVFSSILSGFSGSASVSKIASTANSVISKIDTAFTGGRRSSLVKFVQKENRDLTSLAKERDAITTRLQAYTTARSAARSQALDYTNIGTLASGLGPSDLLAGLRTKLSGLRSFTSNLKALGKRGLSSTVINQIIGLGPDQGAIYASELMQATSGQIKQFNSLEAGIGSAAKTYGIAAANSQVGGNIAKDFVSGLVSQQGRLSDAMTRAARAFAKQIETDFDRQAASVKAKTVKVKVTKHDTGGLLPVGLSVNLNETGRPEPVLTPKEEAQFKQIAAGNAGWAGRTEQNILQGAHITVNSDSDVDAMGQRLALILRSVQ